MLNTCSKPSDNQRSKRQKIGAAQIPALPLTAERVSSTTCVAATVNRTALFVKLVRLASRP